MLQKLVAMVKYLVS